MALRSENDILNVMNTKEIIKEFDCIKNQEKKNIICTLFVFKTSTNLNTIFFFFIYINEIYLFAGHK